jgi:hypothetical protein
MFLKYKNRSSWSESLCYLQPFDILHIHVYIMHKRYIKFDSPDFKILNIENRNDFFYKMRGFVWQWMNDW